MISFFAGKLISLHAVSGLPWHTLLPIATFALRTSVSVPLALATRTRARRLADVNQVLQAWQATHKTSIAVAGNASVQNGRLNDDKMDNERKRDLQARVGVSRWRVVLLPLTQVVYICY